MPGPALVVSIIGNADKLNGALGSSEKSINAFGKSIDLGMIAKATAATAVVAVAAEALYGMAQAAETDAAEARRLELAIANAGAATGDYKAIIDAAISSSQRKAITDTAARDALVPLITTTKDATLAAELLVIAQDVAAQTGGDATSVANALSKAYEGNDTALRKMLPSLDANATGLELIRAAGKGAAGQADASATSSARMAIAMDELGETVGTLVLPVLEELLPALLPLIDAFGELIRAVLPVLIPLVKGIVAYLGQLAKVITDVVRWLTPLIAKLLAAADAVARFLDDANPLKGFSLPSLPFASSSAGTSSGLRVAPAAAVSSSAGAGSIVVNITGDPLTVERQVISALRSWSRRNTPSTVARGILE